ncbi:uncharacterized protein LOC108106040 [Drosophila eugracilis]|uniref:uncharacterized protein LOC108106040 n=1 Tax=Drosophila eugracilis TaxID=29029 RepID=UPI0007E6B66D|nr:uncharacterized protein LOC108106040 [Drosophila eugracilis]
MTITELCIELRPNLCSGVAFLQFDQELNKTHVTRVVIRNHNVYICERDKREQKYDTSSSDSDSADFEEMLLISYDQFGMDIKGLGNFLITCHNISFRFNYNQIDLDKIDAGAVEVPLAPILLNFQENEAISINCRNCRAELVEAKSYRRLREFPSCVVDPSEFFCHNHGPAGTSAPISLVPAETDLFYGLNYVIINFNGESAPFVHREDHVYCKRCMRFLGLTMFNGAAARLWADAVRWLPSGAGVNYPKRHFFKSSTLSQLVKRLIHSLWPQPLPQLCLTTSRAVLVTSLPNRKKHYVFLHVVEPELRVLRRIHPDSDRLCCQRACKVYYDFFEGKPPLLEKWQAQQTLPQMDISPDMFQALVKRLHFNGLLIPHEWRFNSKEEKLELSYFFYENEEQPDGVDVKRGDDGDPYETDKGGLASDSDDLYSETDTASEDTGIHWLGNRTLLKRCPTPPRSSVKMSTSSSSSSEEDK